MESCLLACLEVHKLLVARGTLMAFLPSASAKAYLLQETYWTGVRQVPKEQHWPAMHIPPVGVVASQQWIWTLRLTWPCLGEQVG